jgi:hypothetical protein
MTARAKVGAVALEVLQPLKDFSQNEQRAFLDLPFFAAVLFETLKYCQTLTQCASAASFSGVSGSSSSPQIFIFAKS